MLSLQERISSLIQAKERWLYEQEDELQKQIENTVSLGFQRSDVLFALKWVNERVTESDLQEWTEKIDFENGFKQKKALFFHAGNLPLVGFQDGIAAILSGVEYYGKLSRKDPFLLSGFLKTYQGVSGEKRFTYDTDFQKFAGIKADRLIFSGSEQSSEAVLKLAIDLEMVKPGFKKQMRTAHFSVALFQERSTSSISDLVESVLRYDGEGCRSVKCVVSEADLSDYQVEIYKNQQEWMLLNRSQSTELSDFARYQKAYFESLQKPVTKLGDKILIQDELPKAMRNDVIYWIKGNGETVTELKRQFGAEIQSFFTDKSANNEVELLRNAQFPPIYWKPDGIDILKWLVENHLS